MIAKPDVVEIIQRLRDSEIDRRIDWFFLIRFGGCGSVIS